MPCCTARNRHDEHRRETNTKTAAAKPDMLEIFAALQTQCGKLTASRSASVIVARSPAQPKPHSSARSGDHSRIALAHLRTIRQSTRSKSLIAFASRTITRRFAWRAAIFVTQTKPITPDFPFTILCSCLPSNFLRFKCHSQILIFTRQRVHQDFFLELLLPKFIG